MFRKNQKHTQPALISAIHDLPEKQRTRLDQSWAGAFYRDFFCRIDEGIFEVLYSEQPSRPNIPVNVLVGLEAMKAGFGWSDEELYENFLFNLQVRYALGLDRLGDGEFEIRTLYYFRERLSIYNNHAGVNLLETVFEKLTDKQLVELKVRTGIQRMDSTQIASNILDASRLQLLVEGVRRLHRIASEDEQKQLAELFAPFTKESSGHYAYRVKGKEATKEHLRRVGEVLVALLQALAPEHQNEVEYKTVNRLVENNYNIIENEVKTKENEELTSGCLQSLDDLDATFRRKQQEEYKGYVANVTETCDPENELQLITKIQVAPNNIADDKLLKEALPDLKERTGIETLYTDGGYPSASNDVELQKQNVRLIQTGIRGSSPDPEHFSLVNFQIEQNNEGEPVRATCPNGQTTEITLSRKVGYFARFPVAVCSTCPFQISKRCRAKPQVRDKRYFIDFVKKEMQAAERRKDYLAQRKSAHNLRSAVEATVRSIKHPFPAGKLPVRGQFRMFCMVIASAMFVNLRRISRFRNKKNQNLTENELLVSFCSYLQQSFEYVLAPFWGKTPKYSDFLQ
jgi:hypothetical protein